MLIRLNQTKPLPKKKKNQNKQSTVPNRFGLVFSLSDEKIAKIKSNQLITLLTTH